MTWGLVARADQGGLGNLSREIVRHLDPDRILNVYIPARRGEEDPRFLVESGRPIYFAPYSANGGLPIDECRTFLDGLDVVLGLETWYDPRFLGWAQRAGVRTHLYAMRELWAQGSMTCQADRIWFPEPIGPDSGLPTDIRGHAPYVLPWPCSPDVAVGPPAEPLTEDRPLVVLHPMSAAMLDRNGTAVLREALALADVEIAVRSHSGADVIPGQIIETKIGRSTWTSIGYRYDRWEDQYRLGDLLVLPRRYGWLSLPVFEAAAAGIPSVLPHVWPNYLWTTGWTFRAGDYRPELMKGGHVNVYRPDPRALADLLERLSRDRVEVATNAVMAKSWARARSWDVLADQWRKALEQ